MHVIFIEIYKLTDEDDSKGDYECKAMILTLIFGSVELKTGIPHHTRH
jgi:hypothetical protein